MFVFVEIPGVPSYKTKTVTEGQSRLKGIRQFPAVQPAEFGSAIGGILGDRQTWELLAKVKCRVALLVRSAGQDFRACDCGNHRLALMQTLQPFRSRPYSPQVIDQNGGIQQVCGLHGSRSHSARWEST